MAARESGGGSPARAGAVADPSSEIVDFLLSVLSEKEPHFVVVQGRVGSGKSTLLRTLIARYSGAMVLLAYQASTAVTNGPPPPTPMLLVDPQMPPSPGTGESSPRPGESLLAFSPERAPAEAGVSSVLAESVARLAERGAGAVIVDSWDRASEAFFRARAGRPEMVRQFQASPTELLGLRAGIVSTPVQLVLGVLPELGADLLSIADVVVSLEEQEWAQGRFRTCRLIKSRRHGAEPSSTLYTLEGERFRSLPALASTFRPVIGVPDPDPDPASQSGWPGSLPFAVAFGRLRFGGMTGITTPPDCPDTLPLALAGPLVVHTLRSGGRVVWMPSPEVRPTRLIGLLKELVPEDWLRERFRVLSASGDDPGLGSLRPVVLPLTREVGEGRDLRAAIAGGTGPLFPDVFRFLRDHPPNTTAVYVVSL
ncbi:MAG TPA: hypothetical protein VMG36_04490, partial [Thermoplasmata archaeon]|nr:hypothetical protein [Thermoplasmata archaeon]